MLQRACGTSRDVVLTKKCGKWGTHLEKLAILKQLQIHFKAKHEKGVGTPFPLASTRLHPWVKRCSGGSSK